MLLVRRFDLAGFRHYVPALILCFCLLVGCICGISFAANAGDSYSRMMLAVPSDSVSIPGLLAVAFLPFLISAFAVSASMPFLVYPVCFCKAFLYGSCAWGIWLAYGNAAWLVGGLLQFSDVCLIPVLCWFVLRNGTQRRPALWQDFKICCGIAAVVGILDSCMISPFLAMLIDF